MVQAVVVESSEAPERTYPYPPRFWWLPRLSAVVVIVIAVVVARWCWGAVAHTRVTAVIDAARARGEPIVAADYPANPPPPGDDNAASYLRRAGTTIKFSRTQEWAVEYATHTALSQEMGAVIDALVAASAKELADVRTAGRFDKADWAIPMSRPMWTTLLHDLPRQRNLFLLTRAAALRAAQREDHAAALDYVRDGRVIARAVSAQPYHVSQNMATRTNARVLAALSEIVPDVRIADRSPASTAPATRAVSREQVQTLIAELLADEELRARGMRSGIHGDRAMHLDAAEHIATKSLIAKPAMRLDGLRLVGLDNGAVAAAIGPDWPTARALLPRLAATPPPPRGMVRMVSDSFKPKWDELLLEHYRVTAHARLAATALAIRLYQHDHAGQRPPTLEALVPRYLPVVPRDPFATGNQPIRYLADAQRPYLYSVGENGIDDTATGWRPAAGEMKPLEAADAIVNLFREQDVSYIFPDAPETKPSK